MCLAQGPQQCDGGEAQTRGPSVSRQALYHWATVLSPESVLFILKYEINTLTDAMVYDSIYLYFLYALKLLQIFILQR